MECGAPAPLSRSLVSRPTRKLASRHRKPNTVSHLRTRRVRKPNRICRFHTLQSHASVTIPKSITSTLFVKQRGVWGQKSNKKRNQPQLAGLGARLPWTVQPRRQHAREPAVRRSPAPSAGPPRAHHQESVPIWELARNPSPTRPYPPLAEPHAPAWVRGPSRG